MYIRSSVLLLLLLSSLCVNIDAIRRGSFGKRIPKTSKARGGGGGGGGGGNGKDTTSEPETESRTLSDMESFDHDFQCQGVDIKLTEKQINDIKECGDHVGIASKKDMTIDKVPCFAKCVLEKKQLVDEEGKPHRENILTFYSNSMPEAAREPITSAAGRCIDLHSPMVDPKDESCHTYTPLALCMHLALVDICRTGE